MRKVRGVGPVTAVVEMALPEASLRRHAESRLPAAWSGEKEYGSILKMHMVSREWKLQLLHAVDLK